MQKRINLIVVMGVLLLFSAKNAAQNGTNSPYTRYGYGDLADRSFGAGRSMGGVGIGLRSSKQINPMNPASYSSMDSLTFLFDFGASAQLSWYKDGSSNKQNDINGNVEYMAMQFPLLKRVAMSIGLLPYSGVGYKYGESKSSNGETYFETYTGTGGLNQLYSGLSIDIWKRRLSVGANVNYLFGTINHSANTSFSSGATSVTRVKEFKIRDVMFDFGVQYTHPLSKTDQMILGLTFSPKKRLNNDTYESVSSSETVTDTISATYDIPNSYGIGLSFVRNDKLIVAADFSYQDWNKVLFAGQSGQFKNRTRIAAGAEYIPNFYSRPYINRMRYRFGLNYTDSYVKVDGHGYKEYGATVGFGFPISDNRSYINLSFEYVKIKPSLKTMVDENYFRMTLSYTFNEYWFFKQKIN